MLGAIDFTTVEVWTRSGLVTFYLLFVMEVGHPPDAPCRVHRESERGLDGPSRTEPHGLR